MNNLFVPYPIALALKEIGFDEPVRDYYRKTGSGPFSLDKWINWNDDEKNETAGGMTYVSAPLYQQVFRWFREKHDIKAGVCYYPFPQMGSTNWYWQIFGIGRGARRSEGMFVTYEEAELACIREMIKIVKNGK